MSVRGDAYRASQECERCEELQRTITDLHRELEARGKVLLELEADCAQAKKAAERIAELLAFVSRERKVLKAEQLQVTAWWATVDDYVRKHPSTKLGAIVSAEALRLLREGQAYRISVDLTHDMLDETGLIPKRSASHRSLPDRIKQAIAAARAQAPL